MIEFSDMQAAGPYLPHFFSKFDRRSAREQVDANYGHGGGWQPFKGFSLNKNGEAYSLKYPGDPECRERCRAMLREELLILFEHDWFAIIQPDGSWEVARLD